jgi:DNA-binding transcriptional regulator YdaS (Cro superfamily)
MKLSAYLGQERGRIAAVARAVGMAPAFLWQIANKRREMPVEYGARIEVATGHHVRRWDLRPDDWHLIWPELVGTEGAPVIAAVQEVADAA